MNYTKEELEKMKKDTELRLKQIQAEQVKVEPTIEEGITKRQAALEVYTRLKQSRFISIISVIGFLIVAGAATINQILGSVMALVFSVSVMVYMAIVVKEMNALKFNYKINKKAF